MFAMSWHLEIQEENQYTYIQVALSNNKYCT